MKPRWKPEELKRLQGLRKDRVPVAGCARLLGRSEASVKQKLKWRVPQNQPMTEVIAEELPKLYAQGLCDRAVAECLNVCVSFVRTWRRKHGHKANWLKPETRPLVKAASLARCGPRRTNRDKKLRLAAAQGWPDGCLPMHARVMAALEPGPATPAELADRLGRKGNTVRRVLALCAGYGWVEPCGLGTARVRARRPVVWGLTELGRRAS